MGLKLLWLRLVDIDLQNLVYAVGQHTTASVAGGAGCSTELLASFSPVHVDAPECWAVLEGLHLIAASPTLLAILSDATMESVQSAEQLQVGVGSFKKQVLAGMSRAYTAWQNHMVSCAQERERTYTCREG